MLNVQNTGVSRNNLGLAAFTEQFSPRINTDQFKFPHETREDELRQLIIQSMKKQDRMVELLQALIVLTFDNYKLLFLHSKANDTTQQPQPEPDFQPSSSRTAAPDMGPNPRSPDSNFESSGSRTAVPHHTRNQPPPRLWRSISPNGRAPVPRRGPCIPPHFMRPHYSSRTPQMRHPRWARGRGMNRY